LIHKFFLKLREIWTSQKHLIYSLRKKEKSELEVNTDTLLATDIEASVTNERPSK
jgi:hypothetical protein